MRHVIFGAETVVGSAIIRLLSTLGVEKIVACSRTGFVPDGVDKRRIDNQRADLLDIYSLFEVIEEDDIIYNTQVVTDDTSTFEEADLYNGVGLINLLGIATHARVRSVVTYLPQQVGWKIPDKATVSDVQKRHSPLHKSFLHALRILENYWEDQNYGWKVENLSQFAKSAAILMERDNLDSMEDVSSELQPTSKPAKSASSGPQWKPSSGSTQGDPNSQAKGPQVQSSTTPSEGGYEQEGGRTETPQGLSHGKPSSGPELGGSTLSTPSELETDPKNDVIDGQESTTKKEEEEDILLIEMDRIDVFLVRLPRLLGPGVEDPIVKFCRGVRLQRMEVTGDYTSMISWINPIDAARAMIILADPNIELQNYHYNVIGFHASCREIIEELDEINHSQTRLETRSLFLARIKHWLKSIPRIIGFDTDNDFYDYLKYNTTQIFDDTRARKDWDWEPKYSLEKALQDSLKWYLDNSLQ